jgi:hypothetical protein
MHFDSNIVAVCSVTCAIGYLMTVAWLSKGALERKRRQRVCPSCGRAIQARVCPACTS